ncbi:MAG: TonB-dependent receptor [Clostridia bacterium]|nr:TonB-dependent receptor [Clostridia bacterium]
MTKNILFLTVILLGCASVLSAQTISGTVVDTKMDKPLSNATVVITETGNGVYSDEKGFYSIDVPAAGTYTISATVVGYQLSRQTIEVGAAGIKDFHLYLQPTFIKLNNEFVVTARRIETGNYASPEALTILDGTDLEHEAPRTVPEALQGTAGVFMQKTNHGGGSPIIRGLTGHQNLMLIDGIRLNNATFRSGPNQYLSTVNPEMIQTIEVVRGAGSVLYGSDALGGVVNLITRAPSFASQGWKTGGEVYGKYMTDDMQKTGGVRINSATSKMAVTAGFVYNDFGDIIGGDTTGKQIPTGYQAMAGDIKLRMKITQTSHLILAYQYDKQTDVPRYDKIIVNYEKYHFDPQIRQLGYARFINESDNKWIKQTSATISINQSNETRILQKRGSQTITNEHDLVNTWGATVQVNSYPTNFWHFVSGVEYYYDKVHSEAAKIEGGNTTPKRGLYPDNATSSSAAIYTSHTVDWHKLSYIAGVRFNAISAKATDATFGDLDVSPSALVGNASVVYHAGKHYNIIASVYSGFRAPNISDLTGFGSFNYGIKVPNANLKPEKSLNLEAGTKMLYENLSGSLFLYQNNLTDLISSVPGTWQGSDSLDGERVYTSANFEEALIRGIEAQLQYVFDSHWSADGNITYTYGENKTADVPVQRIPPLFGLLAANYRHDSGFWARLEWQSAGKQDRLAPGDIADSRIPDGGTPGWNVFNLRAGYQWQWLHLTAGLTNLLNEDYRIHGSGVNGYGRSAWLAVKVAF